MCDLIKNDLIPYEKALQNYFTFSFTAVPHVTHQPLTTDDATVSGDDADNDDDPVVAVLFLPALHAFAELTGAYDRRL